MNALLAKTDHLAASYKTNDNTDCFSIGVSFDTIEIVSGHGTGK